MKIKASELTGVALDWAVAKCEGYTNLRRNTHRFDDAWIMTPPREEYGPVRLSDYGFSADWAQGGPIIERERITIRFWDNEEHVAAYFPLGERVHSPWYHGETALIAAMRCYVATKMGGTVDVPDELGGVR